MLKGFRLVITAVFLCVCGAQGLAAGFSLPRVASELGYRYVPQSASGVVTLSKPGLVIVIRPGSLLYDVNDRAYTTINAPHVQSNVLYVGGDLVEQLHQLARQYPQRWLAAESQSQRGSDAFSGALSVIAKPIDGKEALEVTGTAPPNAPILVTLNADISQDLPTILLSRTRFNAGADGRYERVISIAPNYFRRSAITVVVSSSPEINTASARVIVGPPNPHLPDPADARPKD